MTVDGGTPSQRVFFASWPDAATRAALLAATARPGAPVGRAVPAENLHLTLEFLGNVPVADVGRLLGVGASLTWLTAAVLLDHLDWWPRARVAVAVPSAPPPALLELHARLRERLSAAGFHLDAQPFRPHVTLARNAKALPLAPLVPPVAWPLDELALVASAAARGAARYVALARWPASR